MMSSGKHGRRRGEDGLAQRGRWIFRGVIRAVLLAVDLLMECAKVHELRAYRVERAPGQASVRERP